jgi:hypothetical protein
MTMIAGVGVLLAILITPYLRPWLEQRSALNEQHREVAQLRQEVADLEQERKRWDDPDYVRAQARDRLNYVMPGDTGYVLITPEPSAPSSGDPREPTAGVAGAAPDAPWYAALWQSVESAGGQPAGSGSR